MRSDVGIIKKDIKSMSLEGLKEYFVSIGERAFRGEQVFKWLHEGITSFAEMTNLPSMLRARLDDEFYITFPYIHERHVSKLDGTIKYLWRLTDGAYIESAVMSYEHGYSVCISTQVGCRMGCVFCASAIAGLERNLAASEMLDQVLFTQIDIGKRISNVVLMGIGEPLDNFENVIRFLELINHPDGLGIGARHITLSTCGVIEYIDKLVKYDIQLTLAISLHAADDETRRYLMPASRDCTVDDLLAVCVDYFRKTGRRVTYEYALIAGVNDSTGHAETLARKLRNTGCHLNIILLNNISERGFSASCQKTARAFTDILKKNGINYTFRRRLGGDIDASCGQLRHRASC